MIREVPGDAPSERVWESDRGRLVVREVSPAVTLFIEQGFLDRGFAALVKSAYDAALARHGRPSIFVDAEHLEGYDPEIQLSATQWLKEHKAHITIQHMLVRSRLTRLGLAVAGLALGG